MQPPVKVYHQRIEPRPKGSPLGRPNRPFRSKYEGTCRRCNQTIHVGNLVVKTSPGYRHSVCVREVELDQHVKGNSAGDLTLYVMTRASAAARDRQLVKQLTRPDDSVGPDISERQSP